jgi:putative OmpL-like beta-barrel porin-2
MRFDHFTTCLVVLCSVAARQATAQDPGSLFGEDSTSLVVSGFAVGSANYDRNRSQNGALASKLALSLFRPWSDQLYLFGQLTTHLASDGGTAETHVEIDNLIVSWTPAGASALTFSFGRFDAPVGFERDDEPLNLIPTPSFTFENARPIKFSGVMGRYALTPRISVLGIVANGWNQEADNNSAMLKLQTFPGSGLAVAVGALYGPEEDSTNASPRTLLTGDATWQPLNRFILQAEAHHGSEADASWTGIVGQAFWRFGRSTGLTVRGELLDDADGVTTGTAQQLSSVTISPWYFFRQAQEGVFTNVEFTTFRLPAFSLRPAVRFDQSDQPVFEHKDGTLKTSNVTALVELVYLF